MQPFIRLTAVAFVVAAIGLLAAEKSARGDGPGTGCLAIERIEADHGACRALVRNRCGRALAVTVQFSTRYLPFVRNPIAARGLEADHHGEPAYGGYSPAEVESSTEESTLNPEESRWFEPKRPAVERVVTDCRVRVTSR